MFWSSLSLNFWRLLNVPLQTLFQQREGGGLEDDFLSLIFVSEHSVLDLVLSGEGGAGRLRKGRKQEMWYVCQCPLWKQEPLSIEFCRLLFVGENGAGGEDCRYRSQACSHHKKFGHRSDCRPRLVWYSARWLIRVIHSSCRDHVWNWKSSIATNNRGEVVFPCCYETCEMSHYHLLSWWQIGFCTDLSIQLNAFKLPCCFIGFELQMLLKHHSAYLTTKE